MWRQCSSLVFMYCRLQNGFTPVSMAVWNDKGEALQLLLETHGDPNHSDKVIHDGSLFYIWIKADAFLKGETFNFFFKQCRCIVRNVMAF